MVAAFTDALNPFQQDFSEAEDFINILRQANAPFNSFDGSLINELLPLQQVADSWIQLALQSFAPASHGIADPLVPATAPQDLSAIGVSDSQVLGGSPPGVLGPQQFQIPNLFGSGSPAGAAGLVDTQIPLPSILGPLGGGSPVGAPGPLDYQVPPSFWFPR
jgi:hypothetical protein